MMTGSDDRWCRFRRTRAIFLRNRDVTGGEPRQWERIRHATYPDASITENRVQGETIVGGIDGG